MRNFSYARGLILTPLFVSQKIMVMVWVVAMVLTGESLSAEKVYILTAVCYVAQLSLNMFVPFGITFMAESYTTTKRIQVYTDCGSTLKVIVISYL